MEAFDLPTLDPDLGLSLVTGLVDGALTGPSALSGFPSLNTLPHTHTVLGYHHVNVHGTESRNQSIIVHVRNIHDGRKTEEVGKEMLGKRTFIGWPFLSEGMVVAVSDELFRYEKVQVGMLGRGAEKVLGTPHNQNGLGLWRAKADRIEGVYSKRFGVVTGPIEVLLHVRPLKGLKRLEDGSFVKDYEGADKETEAAVQMVVSSVGAEDPRYTERPAPPLSEEFPEGSKIFFLGEHAYGVAAQVSATTESSLSVILAFFPSDKSENAQFKSVVQDQTLSSSRYYPAYTAAEMLGLSNRGIAKITSSFMLITSDNQKHNLGLSMKFEAKSLKVVGYSRKDGRHWEFSEKAIQLIKDYMAAFPDIFRCLDSSDNAMLRAADVLPDANPDARVKEIRSWLKNKGVRDFEAVSLFCDQLSKDTIAEIEKLADNFTENKSSTAIKKAIVKGIPRQAVLKPAHAIYRLQGQRFALGDRVTMVQDTGGVPLSAKGTVIGLNSKSMDVVWDSPFMSGTTLGDKCSQYRGSTVEFCSCLNLSDPQFVTSTNPKEQKPPLPVNHAAPFKPRYGPYPQVQPAPGQAPAAGFRPAPASNKPIHIMTNPNRGAGIGAPRMGRGANGHASTATTGTGHVNGFAQSSRGRGGPPRGFASGSGFRGRGGVPPVQSHSAFDRGRGRGGYRGRGRGGFAPAAPLPS
ncbi:hypothetical protein GYMLUDRAFT_180127 [Collybiopsis luxurians FD-317 M1]|uniref:Uncharacterized protein n=1 Tax=Collybiopsis luxurians FD-317 M1 TaxID=944289 RepID=A0A0D0BS23_9AGAR|nr:hypothetical protein GYMLUDRAFT_180127 [Collybiopsis luxurians FD-317 M1]